MSINLYCACSLAGMVGSLCSKEYIIDMKHTCNIYIIYFLKVLNFIFICIQNPLYNEILQMYFLGFLDMHEYMIYANVIRRTYKFFYYWNMNDKRKCPALPVELKQKRFEKIFEEKYFHLVNKSKFSSYFIPGIHIGSIK